MDDFKESIERSKYKFISTGYGFDYLFMEIDDESIIVIDSDADEHELQLKDIVHVSK